MFHFTQSINNWSLISLDQYYLDKEVSYLSYTYHMKFIWISGKIEEDEDPFDCAIREVGEETSFDITSLADRNFYIEKVWTAT